MSLRNQRLLRAAILFSRTIGEADGASILMGGGAAIALGSKRRETKDLDFNLPQLTLAMTTALHNKGIATKVLRPGRLSGNIQETAPGTRDATSIDLAIKPDICRFIGKYTKEIQGITVADERLLLVDKLTCFGGRSENQDQKIMSDLQDILFCVSRLDEQKLTVPEDLAALLTQEVWELFWRRLAGRCSDEDFAMYLAELPPLFSNPMLPS